MWETPGRKSIPRSSPFFQVTSEFEGLTNEMTIDNNNRHGVKEEIVENSKKRVVVTGVGPITPVGFGKEAYWKSLVQGKSSFKRLEFPGRDMNQYRSQIGAPIDGFDIYQLYREDQTYEVPWKNVSVCHCRHKACPG